MDWTAEAIAEALVKRFEDFNLKPVPDTGSRWQILWGMNFLPGGAAVTANTPPFTEAEAEPLFQARLQEFVTETNAQLGPYVVGFMLPAELGAIYSFAWNEGEGNLKGSTMERDLNAFDMGAAAAQLPEWVFAGGVKLRGSVTRRLVEQAVFTRLITPDQIASWQPPAH